MPALRFEGLVNARDVGGLPTVDGRRVRTGVLYRSETPQLMTRADVQRAVDELGIAKVIDLRGPRGGGSGSLGADGRGIAVDFLDLGGSHAPGTDLSADGFLAGQLDRAGPAVGVVLSEIVSADGPALVHCHTGKDRTGFTIAVILAVLGVADQDIVADYQRSAPVFTTMMDNLVAAGLGVPAEAPEYARHAPSTDGIDRMLARLRGEWPDPATFLTGNGAAPELIERARTVLLEADPRRSGAP